MAKRTKNKKPMGAAISAELLEARTNAKRIRAHQALEREIVSGAKKLRRLIEERDASLFVLARDIVERDGQYTLETKDAPAVSE